MGISTSPKRLLGFVEKVTLVHMVSYFIAGSIFSTVFDYSAMHSAPEMSCFMRPFTSPIITFGPVFQFIRGPIILLALIPLRRVFLERKGGWAILWGILFILMQLAPQGVSPGTIEGWIYTKIPASFGLKFLPESIIYTGLLAWIVFIWERRAEKRSQPEPQKN
jgi:hypothetical protein